jgi:dTDP-glucose 4,6-dehydratase
MGLKLLVTGGAGFIGSNFTKMVVGQHSSDIEKMTVLDKLTYAGNLNNLADVSPNDFEFIKGDICDRELVLKLCRNHDAWINFAAESHVDRSIENSEQFIQTNVLGVQTLLESARELGEGRLIQVSTDEVYGSIDEGTWDELQPLQPNSPYSASKASGDLIARAFHNTFGVDVVVTRCSNNYGPYQNPEKVIPRFITNLIQNKPIEIYGDGSNVRDWLHVSDHCNAIWSVLSKGKSGSTYNIGGGLELNNVALAQKILEVMNLKEDLIKFIPDRLGHDFRYSVDYSKASAELGYYPKVSFEEGLSSTIDWYLENYAWWKSLVTE